MVRDAAEVRMEGNERTYLAAGSIPRTETWALGVDARISSGDDASRPRVAIAVQTCVGVALARASLVEKVCKKR